MAEDNASQSKNDIPSERIEVDLGPEVGTKVFANFQELEAWLQKEKSFWQGVLAIGSQPIHVTSGDRQSVARLLDKCLGDQRQVWHDLDQMLKEFKMAHFAAAPGKPVAVNELIGNIRRKFEDAFEHENGIPSESRTGKFLEQLSKDEGPLTATVAFGVLSGGSDFECRYDWAVKGTIAAYNYRNGVTSQLKAEGESLNQFHTEWVERFNAQRELVEQECAKSRELVSKAASLHQTQEGAFEALLKAANEDWEVLKKTYDEKLALEAPVTYWKKRAEDHGTRAEKLKQTLRIGSSCFVMTFLALVAVFLVDWFGAGVAPQYSHIAVVVSLGLLGVWLLRLIVRLYLSNVHLETDANERMTMVQTYLALQKDKPMDEKHRALVLKAIFRPATTGVVKDDGMPVTPVELLTRR